MANTLMAGAAKVAITPPMGSAFQSSRADLRVESVLHDLYATAVVLSDGEHKAAIVGLDVLGLDATLVNAVRARIQQQTDIPGAHVLVNAAHNHFGPALLQALPDEIDDVYYQGLVQSPRRRRNPRRRKLGAGRAPRGRGGRKLRHKPAKIGKWRSPVGPEL